VSGPFRPTRDGAMNSGAERADQARRRGSDREAVAVMARIRWRQMQWPLAI